MIFIYFLPLAVDTQEEITVDIKKTKHIVPNFRVATNYYNFCPSPPAAEQRARSPCRKGFV